MKVNKGHGGKALFILNLGTIVHPALKQTVLFYGLLLPVKPPIQSQIFCFCFPTL